MKPTSIIYAIALGLTMVINVTLIVNSFTRRTAEELQKISLETAEKVCIGRGGMWLDDSCFDKIKN
jgi:hypothetical protein